MLPRKHGVDLLQSGVWRPFPGQVGENRILDWSLALSLIQSRPTTRTCQVHPHCPITWILVPPWQGLLPMRNYWPTLPHLLLIWRPVKYFKGVSDTQVYLFRLVSIQFYVVTLHLQDTNAPISTIQCTTFASLAFNDFKNAVQQELIVHGLSGHVHVCAIKRIIYCVEYL